VAAQALAAALLALLWWATHALGATQPWVYLGLLPALGYALLLGLFIGLDHLSRGLQRLVPCEVSIYDPAFWRHERHWKLGLAGDSPLLAPLAGTPLRGWLWRCMGVRVGRQLLDDGASLTEKTLVSLGDHCTLGEQCTLQGHSLEDGVFKSGRVQLGQGCSVGAKAYVHYDVALGDGAAVAPDAFLMKGERPAAGECWQGNPAQPLRTRRALSPAAAP
jgi:non-ribosomal peptide synthetase-like protein